MCPVGTGFLSALPGERATNKQEYFGMHKVRVNFTLMTQAPPGCITLVDVLQECKDERDCSSLSGSSDLLGGGQVHRHPHYKVESKYKDGHDGGQFVEASRRGGICAGP